MSYTAVTFAEMRLLLQQKWESVPFWTTEEANNAINEALLVWNSLTGYWQQRVTVLTQANAWDYPLPASMVFGFRVEFNGKTMGSSSIQDMDDGKPGWRDQTTADGGSVPDEPKIWVPISLELIAIWPADALGNNVLTLDGMAQTPRLVNDADVVDIGQDELNMVLGYALHVASLKEGGARFAATQGHFQAFLKAANENNAKLMESAQFRHFAGMDLQAGEQ